MASGGYKNAYGKKPLWQWVLIYLVIGGIIYALIYYFIYAKKGNSYISPVSYTPTQNSASDNIYLTKTDASKGVYMTDFAGMTLYTYDKDTKGVSNCSGGCLVAWPAYTSGATAQGTFPANITVITRSDGSKQFAWKGMPLYYYAKDKVAGDITGDGVGGVWHIVKP